MPIPNISFYSGKRQMNPNKFDCFSPYIAVMTFSVCPHWWLSPCVLISDFLRVPSLVAFSVCPHWWLSPCVLICGFLRVSSLVAFSVCPHCWLSPCVPSVGIVRVDTFNPPDYLVDLELSIPLLEYQDKEEDFLASVREVIRPWYPKVHRVYGRQDFRGSRRKLLATSQDTK